MAVETRSERRLPDSYYDGADLDNLHGFPVVLSNPSRLERKEIEALATFNKGVMLVTGKAGSGKDAFAVSTAYENKRFWGRRILLDFKPRRLFGEYVYFDPIMMQREVDKMAKAASLNENDMDEPLTKKQEMIWREAADEWIGGHEILLKGSVLYLSELRRYCYNRNPHNRVNKSIGALCTQWRHLDMLIIGTHVQEHEIDRYTFKGNVTHWVTCDWMVTQLNTTEATIRRGAFLSEYGNFDVRLKPLKITVDGGQPRRFLSKPDTIYSITPLGRRMIEGNGLNGAPELEVLAYLNNAGAKEAAKIAEHFGATNEVIDGLLFNLVGEGYAKGNRFYDLYNTKNMVNLRPAMRRI